MTLRRARMTTQRHGRKPGGGASNEPAEIPATLVFVCVAGEEQGLNGSRHLAKLQKSKAGNWKAC